MISDDLRRYPKSGEDVIEVKLRHSLCVDGFIAGKKYGHFGTPLIGNSEYRVVPLGLRQFDNEVHGNSGEWMGVWLWKYGG